MKLFTFGSLWLFLNMLMQLVHESQFGQPEKWPALQPAGHSGTLCGITTAAAAAY